MDEETNGVILDSDLPLSSLARSLRMAEVQVYRRMLELVQAVRPSAPSSPAPRRA